ncbi:Eco57I restriction-modification methylase domain-containing protein [Aeromonas caviae]
MGSKGMNAELKEFAKKQFPDSKSDLFAMFMESGFDLLKPNAFHAMVTMQSWMFLSSYENLRIKLLNHSAIECMAHMANMVMGIAFGTAATVCRKGGHRLTRGGFCYVEYEDIDDNGRPKQFPPLNERNLKAVKQGKAASEQGSHHGQH